MYMGREGDPCCGWEASTSLSPKLNLPLSTATSSTAMVSMLEVVNWIHLAKISGYKSVMLDCLATLTYGCRLPLAKGFPRCEIRPKKHNSTANQQPPPTTMTAGLRHQEEMGLRDGASTRSWSLGDIYQRAVGHVEQRICETYDLPD